MAFKRQLAWIGVLLCGSLSLLAQTPDLQPNSEGAPVPTISFEFELPGANPSHYAISVESTGQAAYRSEDAPQNGQPAGEPYMLKFVISQPTRSRIFQLAQELDFFQKKLPAIKGRVANMGAKVLTFRNGSKENRASYNYSPDPKVQELTTIFQNLSNTLEFKRRLERMHQFEPLALDSELKDLEEAQKSGRLAEMQLLEPILTEIANDHGVMNVARRRAESLLARMRSEAQAKQ